MRTTWTLALLVACEISGKPDDTSIDDTDDTDTTDTDTIPIDTDDGVDRSAALSGILRDSAGTALEEMDIRFCRGSACRTANTDATGTFTFDDVEVDWHSFEAVPPEGSGLATVFFPLGFATDQARDLDVTIPTLDPQIELPATAAEFTLGEGLMLTVGTDDIQEPDFVDPATHAAGVRVDGANWPPVDREGSVVAMWYLVPFDHHATNDGLPIRFDNGPLGLTEGATYQLWVGSYSDATWVDAGQVTESGGLLEGDAKLPMISTVALVEL